MGVDLREKGVPIINHTTCTGCGRCAAICPDAVLTLEDGKPRAGAGAFLGCIACGHCVAVCPTCSIAVSGRGMALDDAVDLQPAVLRATADQLESLLLARRSIRRFTKQEISLETIDRILQVISTAPMGIPPHDVGIIVLHGHDRVQAMAADACEAFRRMGWFFSPMMLGLMRPLTGKDNYRIMRGFVKPLLQTLVRKHGKARIGLPTMPRPLCSFIMAPWAARPIATSRRRMPCWPPNRSAWGAACSAPPTA